MGVFPGRCRGWDRHPEGPEDGGGAGPCPMALALRCLSRRLRLPLPLPARRHCGGGPAQLPPGGYGAWQERAARDPAAFWAEAARGWLRWDSPFHTACEAGWDGAGARWFLGGRLNVSGKAAPPLPRGCARGDAVPAAAGGWVLVGIRSSSAVEFRQDLLLEGSRSPVPAPCCGCPACPRFISGCISLVVSSIPWAGSIQ